MEHFDIYFPKITINRKRAFGVITRTIANYYDITVESLSYHTNKMHLCRPRQIVFYMAYHYNLGELDTVAKWLNPTSKPFDHSTVLHSKNTITNLIDTDKFFRVELLDLKEEIEQGFADFEKNVQTKVVVQAPEGYVYKSKYTSWDGAKKTVTINVIFDKYDPETETAQTAKEVVE